MGIFADLQDEQAKQKRQVQALVQGEVFTADAHNYEQQSEQPQSHTVEQNTAHQPAQIVAHVHEQEHEQKLAQEIEQLDLPPSEAIEWLRFQTRHTPKSKLNTTVPAIWKVKLDQIAQRLGVGKYDLLAYIIGEFLDEVPPKP